MDSKGDVKEFFGLRFGRFSARVQMVFDLFASAVSRWCLHRLGMCSVAPTFVLCMWILKVTPWLVLCGSKDCFFCFMWIYVDSKGDVKAFFGLRFGRFSARVQMVFGSFCICSVQMVFA